MALIKISVRQLASGGMVNGEITAPVDAIDWFGDIDGRHLVSVRGEKFQARDLEQLQSDVEQALSNES